MGEQYAGIIFLINITPSAPHFFFPSECFQHFFFLL